MLSQNDITRRNEMKRRKTFGVLTAAIISLSSVQQAGACTGITLVAEDGAVVFGRTQEWGTFDLRSRVAIIPRGYAIQTVMPDGKKGLAWSTKYGTVGLDVLEKDLLIDGMNEKGLSVNLFYNEGFTEYAEYDPKKASQSVPILALAPYLLTAFESVDEVRKGLADLPVVGVPEEAIGGAPPVHMMVTDRSGKAIVVEFTKGVTTIHDAPLGVITNGPNYDWHINNLLNYANVDVPLPHRTVVDLRSMKFGAGARLYGLPGDLTSPSRFLRAAAYASTARRTADGKETMYEIFRILDNFNLTVGTAAAEGAGELDQQGMRSSTIWTTAYDTKNLVLQYHTMHNRRVRQIDYQNIDFDAKEIVRIPLDRVKSQDIEEVIVPKGGGMIAGGWSEGEIDEATEDAVAFVLSRMNTSAKLKRILQVKKQVVKGMNYDITFELDNNTVWNAVVYRDLSGEFSITKTSKVR
jgi:choloylglycine hydrolase